MEFTYNSYIDLLNLLKSEKYSFCNYHNYIFSDKIVIIRHDIDYSLDKALQLAQLEAKLNICSTYFVLLSSDFYNIASKRSIDIIKKISILGHDIGLHFDEEKYCDSNESVTDLIQKEVQIMSDILNLEIKSVSMHRPSRQTLESNYIIRGITNSYGYTFFHDFKYVSDSRMKWREDIIDLIKSRQIMKFHILTHAFWYSDTKKDIKTILKEFINSGNYQRHLFLRENFTNLDEYIISEDIK